MQPVKTYMLFFYTYTDDDPQSKDAVALSWDFSLILAFNRHFLKF